MPEYKIFRKRWFKILGLVFVAFFASTFATALKLYTFDGVIFIPEFWGVHLHMFTKAMAWIPIGLIIYWLYFKIPLNREQWKRNLPIHLVLCYVMSSMHLYIDYYISVALTNMNVYYYSTLDGLFRTYSRYNILIYWGIIGFTSTLENYRKFREREKEAAELALTNSRLETQLAKSQLQALKMQLQPHFLFNTLHTINWLMLKDVEAAASTITLLSDLLRISLEMTDKQEITLKDEVEFIQKYIEIQKTRFKDRLNVEIDLQPETLDAAVPTLILQPITENAFAHGISPHDRKGVIKISSRMNNGSLVMEVHDNGDGIDPEVKTNGSNGIGLSNSMERLRQIYSNNHKFDLKDSSLGGLLVQIEIPYKKFVETK